MTVCSKHDHSAYADYACIDCMSFRCSSVLVGRSSSCVLLSFCKSTPPRHPPLPFCHSSHIELQPLWHNSTHCTYDTVTFKSKIRSSDGADSLSIWLVTSVTSAPSSPKSNARHAPGWSTIEAFDPNPPLHAVEPSAA